MLHIIFLVGGSGSGKSSLEKALVSRYPNEFSRIVSVTSRQPREGEIEGRDYRFISEDEFKKGIDQGRYLQHTHFSGNYYGTLLDDYRSACPYTLFTALPQSILDVKEALVKQKITFDSTIIHFDISLERLVSNMAARGDLSQDIHKRLSSDRINKDFLRLGLTADLSIKDEDLTPDLFEKVSRWLCLSRPSYGLRA